MLEPPVDAIAEFRILTHGAPAEFGHSTGSTTSIITRSGSNQIHGSVWEFLRNDAMDASDFIAREVTPLKQNQFGLTLGGPVRRDKTFFFGFYEGFRNREGRSNIIAVPSLLERTGDFSEMCPEGFSGGFSGIQPTSSSMFLRCNRSRTINSLDPSDFPNSSAILSRTEQRF